MLNRHDSDQSALSTAAFVRRLESIDLTRSSILDLFRVEFDPRLFFDLIKTSRFEIIQNSEGQMSVVRQGSDRRDLSRSSSDFDFHIDGLYHQSVPQFVILYCQDRGVGTTTTGFSDGVEAVQSLLDRELGPMLPLLDSVYLSRDGASYPRPLLASHPRTGEKVLTIGSRAYLRQRSYSDNRELPTLREITMAGSGIFEALDECVVLEHNWNQGDLLFFDNVRYPHRRRALESDPKRQLLRIWLSLK